MQIPQILDKFLSGWQTHSPDRCRTFSSYGCAGHPKRSSCRSFTVVGLLTDQGKALGNFGDDGSSQANLDGDEGQVGALDLSKNDIAICDIVIVGKCVNSGP